MAQTTNLLTRDSIKAIMNKRTLIPAEAVGKRVKMTIQGNGNVIDVRDKDKNLVFSTIPGQEGIVLQKKIFNVRANSQLGMTNQRTIGFLKAALAAEQAGDAEKAHESFNEYLNGCQMSFGVLLGNNSAILDKLASGVEIAAQVIRVDTDNGSLLTIDPSTISVVEPESYGKTTFNLDDFLSGAEEDNEPEETEEERKAREKAEKAAARKAGVK